MLTWKTLLGASCAALAFAALPARADTLGEALAMAYESNPGAEIARAIARADDEQITQAEAAYGPTLSARAQHEFTWTNTHFGTATNQQSGFASGGEISLTQPIWAAGRLAANLDRAQAISARSREDLRDAHQKLILDVIQAYVSVRRDTELYNVASETYALLLEQSNLTASRLRLRDATAPDVDQTVNRLEVAAGQVLEARARLEGSAAQYRAVVGEYPENLAAPPPLPPLPGLEDLFQTAEARNPLLLSQMRVEEITRANLAGARAQLGPNVNAEARAGRIALSPYENSRYSEQLTTTVTVEVPLYQGGALTARVREAMQRNLAAQMAVEEARRLIRSDLASNWNAMQAAQMALPRYQAAVSAAQRAVAGVQQQERSGIRTLRDVLEVTRDLFNARSSAVAAEAELYFRHASVLHDAGLLTIDMFLPDLPQYDPDSYDPAESFLAGLPLYPLLDPLDAAVVRRGNANPVEQVEADNEYEDGEALANPLRPLTP